MVKKKEEEYSKGRGPALGGNTNKQMQALQEGHIEQAFKNAQLKAG